MANLNYQPTTYSNNQAPPISADNLNHNEQGLKAVSDRVDDLVTVEANPSETPTATMESLEVDGTVYKVGGGHAVKNSSGTTMTQRENLQFTDAHTTDDSQGNTTKVEIAKQVTSQEWENATEKGFYLIGDDDDYLLDISQVANADASHIPYASGVSTKQKIDSMESTSQGEATIQIGVDSGSYATWARRGNLVDVELQLTVTASSVGSTDVIVTGFPKAFYNSQKGFAFKRLTDNNGVDARVLMQNDGNTMKLVNYYGRRVDAGKSYEANFTYIAAD